MNDKNNIEINKKVVNSKKRPQSSKEGLLYKNNKNNNIRKLSFHEKYETAYKGYHFLSDPMKIKMQSFKEVIIKNRNFSASQKNQFSLCYPPGEKLKKNPKKIDLNIISMVCLEDYDNLQIRRNINNYLKNIKKYTPHI